MVGTEIDLRVAAWSVEESTRRPRPKPRGLKIVHQETQKEWDAKTFERSDQWTPERTRQSWMIFPEIRPH